MKKFFCVTYLNRDIHPGDSRPYTVLATPRPKGHYEEGSFGRMTLQNLSHVADLVVSEFATQADSKIMFKSRRAHLWQDVITLAV